MKFPHKKSREAFCTKHKNKCLMLALTFILMLFFKKIIIISILIGLSVVVSYFMNNIVGKNIGFELVTLTAVLSGRLYGVMFGMIIALALIIIHLVMSKHLGPYVLWVIPGYCLFGIIPALFPGLNIVTLGIALTIIINLCFIIITLIVTPGAISKSFMHFVTNALINMLLFSIVGQPLFFLMS